MATYAVGDIQGCFDALVRLLDLAKFDIDRDSLWICGDLVNRGEQSLESLRFAKSLPHCKMVLGNHDLHLLAIAHGAKSATPKDTFNDILQSADRDELLAWLQQQPLIHHDQTLGFAMVHAGIPPIWTLEEAKTRARELESCLRSKGASAFFHNMYGSKPHTWSDELSGTDRLRLITNYFTRMRFCDEFGRLELKTKTHPKTAPAGFTPWFDFPQRQHDKSHLLFGHWAALEGKLSSHTIFALDTGCVWGGSLSMLRLEDKKMFSTACTY